MFMRTPYLANSDTVPLGTADAKWLAKGLFFDHSLSADASAFECNQVNGGRAGAADPAEA
jgi:hypothetical protein